VHSLQNKGNRNWIKPSEDIPNTPSSFEQMVRQLKLSEKEYRSSTPLKAWAQKHKDNKYVPQDLLEAWGFAAKL
jgi:hypothetical protein